MSGTKSRRSGGDMEVPRHRLQWNKPSNCSPNECSIAVATEEYKYMDIHLHAHEKNWCKYSSLYYTLQCDRHLSISHILLLERIYCRWFCVDISSQYLLYHLGIILNIYNNGSSIQMCQIALLQWSMVWCLWNNKQNLETLWESTEQHLYEDYSILKVYHWGGGGGV